MSEKITSFSILNLFNNTSDTYEIPLYQRAFAWTETEIIQLIEDIRDFEEKTYYIGSLIVSKNDNKYEVIDGQQRLTALFLLLNSLKQGMKAKLSFACREKSNLTLAHINDLTTLPDGNIEESLVTGKKIIDAYISKNNFDQKAFLNQLKKVKIFRIEVPDNTDLNRYFEIMNTRGEQLEQQDIIKASLMSHLKTNRKKELFAKIWDACSDMTGYVQMHFDTKLRSAIFGNAWENFPEITNDIQTTASNSNTKTINTIENIIARSSQTTIYDGFSDKDELIRFESIISFPYFLLHTLKIFIEQKKLPDLLDDKKLIETFNKVFQQPLDLNTHSWNFITCLLQTRFLFDKYIIKREFIKDNSDGEWSLKELRTSGQQSKKKAYYVDSLFKSSGEWDTTHKPRNKMNLMLQSCFRVSYTSPKVMHWITTLLKKAHTNYKNDDFSSFHTDAENIAINAVNADYLNQINENKYDWGTNTPHIVFNYLDYLLWKEDNKTKKVYNDFTFEFRNSVEHWYPQHPSEETFEEWSHEEGLDNFGNLCLVQNSINSKFSNLSPVSKKNSFEKAIAKGSLKLRLMADETTSCRTWKSSGCENHEKNMIKLLLDHCKTED